MLFLPHQNKQAITSQGNSSARCSSLSYWRYLLSGGLLLLISACDPLFPPEDAQTLQTPQPTAPTANTKPTLVPTPAEVTPRTNLSQEATSDLEVLRPYLRGNPVYGWQPGQLGKPEEFWNQRVNNKPVNSDSAAVTEYLSYVTRENKQDPTTELFARALTWERKRTTKTIPSTF